MTITDPYTLRPTLTSDGRPWVQRCFLCGRGVDFLRLTHWQWVRVGELVRHARCMPERAV